eukprot:6192965-Pleurochrysis_carterae.AAC.1
MAPPPTANFSQRRRRRVLVVARARSESWAHVGTLSVLVLLPRLQVVYSVLFRCLDCKLRT